MMVKIVERSAPFLIALVLALGISFPAHAETAEYDLTIARQWVDFTGKKVRAMTINGGIPGPTLEMKEGDFVVIRVHNRMDVETSIHWHGVLLPNREDGVPYLTTPPILPGSTHVFRFPVVQSGTYWYHSHTGLQEERGVYGSIVIHPREETIVSDREYVLVLSDWIDEKPQSVLRMLKRGSEYYSLAKGTTQSITGAIRAKAVGDMFRRWLDRMPPMDISDVAYDSFLINGRAESELEARPGETVRLRIINASAATYFYLQFAAGPMRVVSADGLNVEPMVLDRFLLAIAETYDVLVRVPEEGGSLEFRATAQDGTGFASVFLGRGDRVRSPDVPKPNLYKMAHMDMGAEARMTGEASAGEHAPAARMSGKMQHGEKEGAMPMKMDMMPGERPLAPYPGLRSPRNTALDPGNPWRIITLNVTGDMERYLWSFNGKTLRESDVIGIRHGENVRIVFENKTMMHHPIHLHGHFFRVLNGQGDHAPLKHTVDIPPMGRQVIEFYAGEDKDWFLHCHILYHMESGMARVVHYEGSSADPDIAEARRLPSNPTEKNPWYFWFAAAALSQMSGGELVGANTRNTLRIDWKAGWRRGEPFEVRAVYERYFNRFFNVFAGGYATDEGTRGILGIRYLLPLLIESRLLIDHRGDFRVELDRQFQMTGRLSLLAGVEYDTHYLWEWHAGAEWVVSRWFSLQGRYHSDYGVGAGVVIAY
jgi:FtsP/CotA-like multicopper oxidase with cupredoxin domain